MKKKFFKKIILSTLAVLYDIISLLWCYIMVVNMVFNLTTVEIGQNGIEMGIIGGADLPTWSFIMVGVFGIAFSVLFVLLSLATVFLLTISVFKKHQRPIINILLCVFSALTLIIFMLIPSQTYAIMLYVLVKEISLLKYFFIVLSVFVLIRNIFPLIKKKKQEVIK
ncbi:MAG: hypothetical protein IKV81_02760 [Clostridia bacterium]|nr:hypothetical protein [Clostridia bacterium]